MAEKNQPVNLDTNNIDVLTRQKLLLELEEITERRAKVNETREAHRRLREENARDELKKWKMREEKQARCAHIKGHLGGTPYSAFCGQVMPDGKFYGHCSRCEKMISGTRQEVNAMLPLGTIWDWEEMGDARQMTS